VLSVTVSVKLYVPVLVGVPEIMPFVPSSFSPGGSDPAKVHTYAGLPPEAETETEYVEPTLPGARFGEVVIASDPAIPALCVTVKVCPAAVSVPLRAAPVLAAIEKPTVPFPVPLAPDVTVIKLALLVAVQPQVEVVITFTVPEPPLA
jgi:hypothetical protein